MILPSQRKANLGFDPERALLVSMDLFPNGYDDKRAVEFYRQLVARVAALPGVESASLSNQVPPLLLGSKWSAGFEIEGYTPRAGETISVAGESVAPGYFHTMRIPLIEGHEFTEADNAQSTSVVIINETMARRYWRDRSPVGRRLHRDSRWSTVIGVARDVKYFGPTEPAQPWIYYPHAQDYWATMTLVARTTGDPWRTLPGVRAAVRALDPTLPVFGEKTLAAHSGVPLFLDRIVVTFLSAFGLVALALAAIGLYGSMAYSVTTRAHELGVRMALGARSLDALKQMLKEGMVLALIGMAIGLAAAFALTRLMGSLLFGVSATDAATFVLVSLLLGKIALLACYFPARRATKVDPMVALRTE